MAFTSEEKAKILYFLGYPAKVTDPNSLEYNSIVNDRFESFPADAEPIARDLISQVEALKTKLTQSHGDMRVKKVGDIELNPDKVASNLKSELKRLYLEISELMNIRYISKKGSRNVRVRY